MSTRAARLRELLSRKEILIAPGVQDALTARLAERCGFDALYMTGAGTVNLQFGLPDHSLITLTEMVQNAERIVKATSLPLISDADTGYGGVLNVLRTVREFEWAGVAGIHLEDQVLPKRCGHVAGKEVVSSQEMVAKIRAARHGRKDADFLIIARVDARAPLGFDEAVRRGRLYEKAGADMIFPEALESEEEFRSYAREVHAPLVVNMAEFGKTPYLTATQFQEMGYRLIIFPTSVMKVALKAVQEFFMEIKTKGTQKEFLDRMLTRAQLYDLLDYREMLELEKEFTKLE